MSNISAVTALNTFTELAPARLASITNLAGLYANGPTNTGVGATLTSLSGGALTLDGVTVNLGDRILLAGQTDASQNGIWVVINAGSSGIAWILLRSGDMQSVEQIHPGAFILITAGNAYAGLLFTVVEPVPAGVGNGNINFKFSTPGGFQNVTVITNPMSPTIFTVPTTATTVFIKAWGGGGAGGGGASGTNSTGGGGGGGGYFEKTFAVSGGQTISLQPGAGGTGVDGGAGNNGGNSVVIYLTTTCTAGGGVGGNLGSATPGVAAAGGGGGAATNGDVNLAGGAGLNGVTGTAYITGGGGAAAGGGGAGGRPAFGAGPGNTGTLPGGGGSAASTNTGADLGGNGANGLIVLYYN